MYAYTWHTIKRANAIESLVVHRIIRIFSLPPIHIIIFSAFELTLQNTARNRNEPWPTSTCISSDPSLSTMITELCEGRWFAIRGAISCAFRYSISPGHRDLTGLGLRGCAFAIVSYRMLCKMIFFFFLILFFFKACEYAYCRDYFLKVLRIILVYLLFIRILRISFEIIKINFEYEDIMRIKKFDKFFIEMTF